MPAAANARWSPCIKLLRLAVLGASFLCVGFALAQPIHFRGRVLEVPDPEGFQPIAKAFPSYLAVIQTATANGLVEDYVDPGAVRELKAGRNPPMERFFQLHVGRQDDGRPVSPAEFTLARNRVQSEIARKATLNGYGFLGAFRLEPWGIFCSFRTRSATPFLALQPARELIASSALVLVDGQELYLYSFATYKGEPDRQWAERSLSAWADRLHAANPEGRKSPDSPKHH